MNICKVCKGAAYLGNTSMNTSSPLLFTLKHKYQDSNLVPLAGVMHSSTWATGFYFEDREQEDFQAFSVVPSTCCYKNTAMQNNTWNWKEFLPPTYTHAYTHANKCNVSRIMGHRAGLRQPPQLSTVSHDITTPLPWTPAMTGMGQTTLHSSSEELGMLQEHVTLADVAQTAEQMKVSSDSWWLGSVR